jgi:hypothetical protein
VEKKTEMDDILNGQVWIAWHTITSYQQRLLLLLFLPQQIFFLKVCLFLSSFEKHEIDFPTCKSE